MPPGLARPRRLNAVQLLRSPCMRALTTLLDTARSERPPWSLYRFAFRMRSLVLMMLSKKSYMWDSVLSRHHLGAHLSKHRFLLVLVHSIPVAATRCMSQQRMGHSACTCMLPAYTVPTHKHTKKHRDSTTYERACYQQNISARSCSLLPEQGTQATHAAVPARRHFQPEQKQEAKK